MWRNALSVMLCFATGTAQACPYAAASTGFPDTVADIRLDIAFFGATCVMELGELDTRQGPTTLASLSEETGVPVDLIIGWAREWAAANRVAVDVLLRGGEPVRDPPEPFLTILRFVQSDCQSLDQSRYRLAHEHDRAYLPAGDLASTIRDTTAVKDLRLLRLCVTVQNASSALAAGDFGADLVALAQSISGNPNVTLDDLLGATTAEAAAARARDLLDG